MCPHLTPESYVVCIHSMITFFPLFNFSSTATHSIKLSTTDDMLLI